MTAVVLLTLAILPVSSCSQSSDANLAVSNLSESPAAFLADVDGNTDLDQERCPGMRTNREDYDLHALKPPGFDVSVGSLIEVLCSAYSRATKVNLLNQQLGTYESERFSGVSVDFVRFTGEAFTFLYGHYHLRHRGTDDFQTYPVAIVIKGAFNPAMLNNNRYMDTKGRFDLALSFATGSPYNDPDVVNLLSLKDATGDLALKRITRTIEYKETKKRTLAGEFSSRIASINMQCIPSPDENKAPSLCRMEFSGNDNWRPGMIAADGGQGGKLVALYQAWLDQSREVFLGGSSYRDYAETFRIKRVSHYEVRVSKHGERYTKKLLDDIAVTEEIEAKFFKLYADYVRERRRQFLADLD